MDTPPPPSKPKSSLKTPALDQRGITLQTVIITAVLALAATGAAIVIYNVVASETEDINDSASIIGVQSIDKNALTLPELSGGGNPPVGGTPDPQDPQNPPGNTPGNTPPECMGREVLNEAMDKCVCPAGQVPNQGETDCVCPGEKMLNQAGECDCPVGQEPNQAGECDCPVGQEPNQAGDGCEEIPPQPSPAIQIDNGNDHTCAVIDDGTVAGEGSVYCWGAGGSGRLGDGRTMNSPMPVKVSNITTATQVSAGNSHTCAVLTDNTVQCWGNNGSGRLGIGGVRRNTSPSPVAIMGISATQVSAGDAHTCAVLADDPETADTNEEGTIQCWGNDNVGQLGNGDGAGNTGAKSTPVEVMGISTAIQVSAGRVHTCAVIDDGVANDNMGSVYCWGRDANGALGNGGGANDDSTTPVEVTGITTATQVSVGDRHTCAVLADDPETADTNEEGTIQCWGRGEEGQLGNGETRTQVPSPVAVLSDPDDPNSPLTDVTAISAGHSHTCALLTDGTVQCWGNNGNGRLGNGTTGGMSTSPVAVSDIDDSATKVSTGARHTCAVITGGAVQCWGDDSAGQLGNGDGGGSNTPVTVMNIPVPPPSPAG